MAQRARRRIEPTPAGRFGAALAAGRAGHRMRGRLVVIGVALYCLIAWAAIFKLADVGLDALKPNPVSYAEQQAGEPRVD